MGERQHLATRRCYQGAWPAYKLLCRHPDYAGRSMRPRARLCSTRYSEDAKPNPIADGARMFIFDQCSRSMITLTVFPYGQAYETRWQSFLTK